MNIKKMHSSRQARRKEKIYWYEKRKQIGLKIEKHKRCAKKEFCAMPG